MVGIESLFQRQFNSSQEAVDRCQRLAQSNGFSVRIRTSKANTVYIVCSKEGRPESRPKKRPRISERCHCSWRVVLHLNNCCRWEFRAGKSMVHNHPMNPPPTDQFPILPPFNSLFYAESKPSSQVRLPPMMVYPSFSSCSDASSSPEIAAENFQRRQAFNRLLN